MKKANFDVSHELDEFLMVEKPLTHSRRKAHPDFEKMKPELRQLEEQYVTRLVFSPFSSSIPVTTFRFTVYDFAHNRRKSYYPHNEPIINSGRGHSSSTDGRPDGMDMGEGDQEPSATVVVQSTTNTLLPTATTTTRSHSHIDSPVLDREQRQRDSGEDEGEEPEEDVSDARALYAQDGHAHPPGIRGAANASAKAPPVPPIPLLRTSDVREKF